MRVIIVSLVVVACDYDTDEEVYVITVGNQEYTSNLECLGYALDSGYVQVSSFPSGTYHNTHLTWQGFPDGHSCGYSLLYDPQNTYLQSRWTQTGGVLYVITGRTQQDRTDFFGALVGFHEDGIGGWERMSPCIQVINNDETKEPFRCHNPEQSWINGNHPEIIDKIGVDPDKVSVFGVTLPDHGRFKLFFEVVGPDGRERAYYMDPNLGVPHNEDAIPLIASSEGGVYDLDRVWMGVPRAPRVNDGAMFFHLGESPKWPVDIDNGLPK